MKTLLALALSLFAQAKDNPEFTWWADHKAGSWVKLKMEMEAQGVKVVIESIHTLQEISKEKAVVEQKTKITAAGQAQPEQTEKEEILKDTSKNPITIEKEGDAEIEVAGKKLKCHWIEGSQKDGTKLKFWLHKDIPGGMAKGEVKGGELPGVMTILVVSWEKK